eukprot:CAMPEP_0175075430 /NCGR_PEP_ID=MMETSP0052_2-20121109/21995_1 /TAXON_ID=51329 ORGANISM="Polytomella parva, Strain SAG 63-3" /NCGR_SAMPLE_ID=MMETSP0052_2 /ASSEMBLY_ACC=CAM_ASM_000194 /LENGTH=104 /DNA_ID=CAMNT_0016344113 /DNA_START=96 /DNA_END=407 /DNA_ORIENTATION=-
MPLSYSRIVANGSPIHHPPSIIISNERMSHDSNSISNGVPPLLSTPEKSPRPAKLLDYGGGYDNDGSISKNKTSISHHQQISVSSHPPMSPSWMPLRPKPAGFE